MVIMASGIARGHVRTTTTTVATKSRNVAAILQKRLTETKLWFTVYFFDIGHQYYDQLTPVKTGYLLTSITWPYRGLKFTAY